MVFTNLIKGIEDYIKEDKILKKIEKIQQNLKLPIEFEGRKKRVQELLKIRDKGKKILQKIGSENKVSKNIVGKIKKIIGKSDHLKRENCLLQVSDVVDVLKSNELCIFKEKSRNNLIETRKYFGFHKNLYYDDDICVSMAVTRPKIIQNYHSHLGMHEYTMVLSGSMHVKGKSDDGVKTLKAGEGDVIVTTPYTVHTLLNKSNKISLNATVKIPIGFSDRKEFDVIPKNVHGSIKVLKLKTIKKSWGEIKSFKRKDNGYFYKIDLLSIKPSKTIKSLIKNDSCIFVINGNVKIIYLSKEKVARKNNLIFISKNIKNKIKNLSKKNMVKLYRVRGL